MDQNLKPAHELLVKLAGETCTGLKATEQYIAAGGLTRENGSFVSVTELQHMRDIQISLLCGYMRLLQEIPIPEDAIGRVIEALNKLDHGHAAIFVATRTLDERRRQIGAFIPEINMAHSSPAFEAARPWNPATKAPMR